MKPDSTLKIAVFIDFDNIEIGVKTTLNTQFDIGAVLEAVKERGEVITKVAYGDWKRSGDHGRAMAQHAVRMVQRVMTPGGDKNGADINLALDALEMAFTHDHINAFVIVGGDSDFITLVEKLKQYDRKVFVVGGRAFTSQVMQKNCTEFIAYENVIPERHARPPKAERGERVKSAGGGRQPIEQAVPLVQRALKVLSDREVSPQLGLLKSTLLQLDSSFSERDYGAGSFRDFADKLAQHGLVSLKHQGRSTLVELSGDPSTQEAPAALEPPSLRARGVEESSLTELLEQPDSVPRRVGSGELGVGNGEGSSPLTTPHSPITTSLGDGVALVRRVLAEAATPPRWPMYPRQFKQFLKNAQPDFDERRYGSIADLMRACQKDGILRLERDRQGGLRVFASGDKSRSSVPHGWATHRENGADATPAVEAIPEVIAEPEPAPVVEAEVTAIADAAPAKPKRASRARKTAATTGEKKKAAPRKKKASSAPL